MPLPQQPTDRQIKLRDLLKAETEEYMKQIALRAIPESSEARAKRLEEEALQLKARKEHERRELCEEKLLQKMVLENDQIRAESSRLFRIETAGYQLEQVREKQRRKNETEQTENTVFEFLNQQSFADRIAREDRERELREAQHIQIRETLDKQVQMKKERNKLLEGDTINDFGGGVLCGVGERESNPCTYLRTGENHTDLMARKKQEKEAQIIAETEENRKIVQDLVERDQRVAEEERANRLKQAALLQAFIEQSREDSAARRRWESELEKELEQETATAWLAREKSLIEQEMKRHELLTQVMEERYAQVSERLEKISVRKLAQREEKVDVEHQVAKEQEEINEEKRKRRMKQIEYARELEQQVRNKATMNEDEILVNQAEDLPDEIISLKQQQKTVYNRMISPHLEKFD